MRLSQMHYFPYPIVIILFGLLALGALVLLVELRLIGYAYEKVGIDSRYVFLILFMSLIGSAINIPIADFPAKNILGERIVEFFGMRYLVPDFEHRGRVTLAINLGGALIPIALSTYLKARKIERLSVSI